MSVSEAQKKATMKYNKENYERVFFTVRKGEKEKIRERAMETGRSVNSYIYDSIEMEMKGRLLDGETSGKT